MAISLVNNLSMNRSDTAVADQVWTATSATLSDFQGVSGVWNLLLTDTVSAEATVEFDSTYITSTYKIYKILISELVPASVGFVDLNKEDHILPVVMVLVLFTMLIVLVLRLMD